MGPHRAHHAHHVTRGRAFGLGLAAVLLAGCSSSSHPVKGALGTYPAFLPKSTVASGSLHTVVDASVKDPALATQGDTVRVHLASGAAVLTTVTGPEVPNEGLPYQSETSPATWTYTFSHATETVPIDARTFQAIDESGDVYKLFALPGKTVPTEVRPGQTVSFQLRTTAFDVGEGRMRWIPSGHQAPVEWDFVVETD